MFLSRFRTEVSDTMGSTTLTVAQLNERIAALEAENARLTRTKAKIDPPPKYGGSKGELSGFLTQARAYLLYYAERFVNEPEKVGFVALRLEGSALR